MTYLSLVLWPLNILCNRYFGDECPNQLNNSHFGHFSFQCNNIKNNFTKKNTKHMIMQKGFSFKRLPPFIPNFQKASPCHWHQQHAHTRKIETNAKQIPKISNLHKPTPSPSFFDKSTTTPLGDKYNQTLVSNIRCIHGPVGLKLAWLNFDLKGVKWLMKIWG